VKNSTIVATNETVPTTINGFSVGPMTINSGVSVTVQTGQKWVII
jgi:hypothetical protein